MADVEQNLWRIDPEDELSRWLEACDIEGLEEDPELYDALREGIEYLVKNPPPQIGDDLIDATDFLQWVARRWGAPLEDVIRAAGGLIEVVEEPDD